MIEYDKNGMIICSICKKSFKRISSGHLATHGLTTIQYRKMFNIDHRDILHHRGYKQVQRALKL